VPIHFLTPESWLLNPGLVLRAMLRPPTLCGARATIFEVTELEAEVTCSMCRADLLGPEQGDLGALLQSAPVPPQRSEPEEPP
jgi:hypothetical protein